MTTDPWSVDPAELAVERALKVQKGSVLARAVLRLQAQVAALTAWHSGACDEMAQCGKCWERERIAESDKLHRQVAAMRALTEELPDLLQVYAWAHTDGSWMGYIDFIIGKILATLDDDQAPVVVSFNLPPTCATPVED